MVDVVGVPEGCSGSVMLTFEPLAAQAWRLYRAIDASGASFLVRPSIPILFFGDSEQYFASPLRVITVGLNPSRSELILAHPLRPTRPGAHSVIGARSSRPAGSRSPTREVELPRGPFEKPACSHAHGGGADRWHRPPPRTRSLLGRRRGLARPGVAQDEDPPVLVRDVDVAARVHDHVFGLAHELAVRDRTPASTRVPAGSTPACAAPGAVPARSRARSRRSSSTRPTICHHRRAATI